MPKRLQIASATPMNVYEATQAFCSELRVHLIHYFAEHPGSRQADAVRALGVERAVVTSNARALEATGVLVRAPDRTYTVDSVRYHELLAALVSFGPAPPETGTEKAQE